MKTKQDKKNDAQTAKIVHSFFEKDARVRSKSVDQLSLVILFHNLSSWSNKIRAQAQALH